MRVSLSHTSSEATYQMVLGDNLVDMNPLVGQEIQLQFAGEIHCQACDRLIKKSYSGGYCFPCSQSLAQCDLCIMKPETCHYDAGTCRDPAWGESFCMQDHIVYLANSSGIKVGITRVNQIPTRWIDQGATQAIPIFKVKTRYQSGLVEVVFKSHVSDRTDWRKMLKGSAEPVDLKQKRDELMLACHDEIVALQQRFGEGAITPLTDQTMAEINYPVEHYPEKVKSHNFDKTPDISGVLQGIKGQYLLLDTGVLNIRKFSGYHLKLVTKS
ncbi:MAG: hypothetical protein COA90_02575 [Gammaproteobacteria bacterium]|nr:MAG: hypothetical protein COA90_02575 [Gammaproteobacteria bacterium]